MAKISLTNLSSPYIASGVTTYNSNLAALRTAIENTLSRDGTSPNQMNADFDLNNYDLLNAGTIDADTFILAGQALVPADLAVTDASLLALSALTPAANKFPYFTSGSAAALADITSAGRALLDDADSNAQLATLGSGASGINIFKSATNTPQFAASRTALKALDTTKFTTAFLYENYRSGVFVFRSGNYSTQITADTQEGIYIKADAIASTAGAWVRQYSGPANIDWFGAIPDDSTDSSTAVNAALALCTTVTGSGDYAFDATINLNTTHQKIIAPNAKFTAQGSGINLFTASGWCSGQIVLRRVDLNSGAGHGIYCTGTVRTCSIWVGEVYQLDNSKSWIYGATGGALYSNTIYLPYVKTNTGIGSPVACSPVINWIISGVSFVANRIIGDYVFGGSTNPAIRVENTAASVYNVGNYIEVRTAEICDAGIVHCAGMNNSTIIVSSYDTNTTTGDLVKLYSSGSGARCNSNRIEFAASTVTLGVSLYHITLTNAYNTSIWVTGYSSTSKFYINNNNMVGTRVISPVNFPAVISNVSVNYPVWQNTLYGQATYNPPSLADGAGTTTTVTVTGAALGDRASAAFSLDLQGIITTAWVSAADTVSVRFQNESGGTLDLASGTLRTIVEKLT